MRLLNDLLAKNVKANPAKVALMHGGRAVSYAELAAEAARVAGALEAMHGTTGNRVGILLRNGPEFLFAYFGAAASGNVAVPVNYHLQADEIAFLLKNSGCSVLFTAAEFLPKVRAAAREAPSLRAVVCAGDCSDHPGARPWEAFVQGQPGVYLPPASQKPEDVAVFLYTSGTTGFPKAAMCTHAGLLSNVATEAALYGMGADDVFGCVLPMFHNYALLDTCLLPLYLGATVAVGEPEDTESLLALVERHEVTFLATMPGQLAEMACGEFARPYDTSSLRMVQTGGAPLATEVWRKFRARYGLPILEGYGCSEASSTVTVMPAEGPHKPASVGRAMPNQEVRIVDDKGKGLPAGVEGEVVVRGPNVFAGYHGLPEETAQALASGWLHTGDLGRLDEEGFLFITGRKKSMINVGGFKVYPAEVEEVLHQVEGVMAACVVASYDPVLGEAVKAFVEAPEGRRPEVARLLRHCEQKLGAYKVPRSIEFRTALPRTGTGKIAAKLLQAEERRAWPRPAA